MSGGRNYIVKKAKLSDLTLDGEIWKDIVGYAGVYKASHLGRIYSIRAGRILKPCINIRNGYCQIPLGKTNDRKSFRVHRLIG